jgi:hypothetical protein
MKRVVAADDGGSPPFPGVHRLPNRPGGVTSDSVEGMPFLALHCETFMKQAGFTVCDDMNSVKSVHAMRAVLPFCTPRACELKAKQEAAPAFDPQLISGLDPCKHASRPTPGRALFCYGCLRYLGRRS